eukprot:9503495-Pyramimonas_sp.AAC.1
MGTSRRRNSARASGRGGGSATAPWAPPSPASRPPRPRSRLRAAAQPRCSGRSASACSAPGEDTPVACISP